MSNAQSTRKILSFLALILGGCVLVAALGSLGPVAIRLVMPIVLVGVVGWLGWTIVAPPGTKVTRRLAKRQFERAFQAAMSRNEGHVISDHLQQNLGLPAESLRPRVVAAFNELRALHASAYDPANTFVSKGLKNAMQQRSDEARNAFWRICRNLAVVADQKVKFEDDHHKIQNLSESIANLKTSAAEVRVKLAELSLGATEAEIEEAAQAIENVRKQTEVLLELESLFHS